EAHKTFTEVLPAKRIAYRSLIDFVPGVDPYQELTVVDLTPSGDSARVIMTMEPLHDEVWTERLVKGRENELDNLGRVIERRHAGVKKPELQPARGDSPGVRSRYTVMASRATRLRRWLAQPLDHVLLHGFSR